MYAAAARRFFGLLGLAGTVAIAGGLAGGLLFGSSFNRSMSVGLYLVGAFLVVAGFFVGNRGPVRIDDRSTISSPLGFLFFTTAKRRWATPEEREEQISSSALFIALGLALIILGVAADNRHELF